MFKNFRLVLLHHQKFLAIFFVVVFLPSVLLAFFGIRSLQNERYKLQQQTLERQRAFSRAVRSGVAALIEKNVMGMRELCRIPAVSGRDYRAIRDSISKRLREGSLLGQIAFWSGENPPWLPDWQPQPPSPLAFQIPPDWTKLRLELAGAENAEFRARDYAYAVAIYERLLGAAKDPLIKAWLLGRMARCEVKGGDLDRAIAIYRRIRTNFRDMPTESGRPLELVSRLEVLSALASLKNTEVFSAESLEVYDELAKNRWSLDGDQVSAYATVLSAIVDQVASDRSALDPGDAYRAAVDRARTILNERLKNWRLAKEVRRSVISDFKKTSEHFNQRDLPAQKRALEFEGQDVLALVVPLDPHVPGGPAEFLGSLLLVDDLRPVLEALVSENGQPDASLRIRSVLSEKVIYGSAEATGEGPPIVTDFFSENFPPWGLETFRSGSGASNPLYKNIFFWTILALLLILLFGSGLIVRTVIHEVRLLDLKSDFIASVSHEFKTPLTSMGAILEHLLDGKAQNPKRVHEYYGILQHDSNRLKRLVGNVLDFSKIEEGKKTYRLKPTDPVELVKREVRSFEREMGIEGFTIGLQSDDHIPPVPLDEEAVGQALHNILDNAARFSPGEKKIDVEIRKMPAAVEITVQDRGIGIPENEVKRICEKFYRGRQAASVSPTGTGLGLALVKHIMDAHRGDVIIRSRPGEGSRVSLVLPVDEGIR